MRNTFGRVARTIACAVLGLALYGSPAAAQTSEVKGTVVGADGKPVDGARVTIVPKDGAGQKFETTTRRGGVFSQSRVPAGTYVVTASKDKLSQAYEVEVKDNVELELKLGAAEAAGADDAKRRAALQTAFAEGARLSNEGQHEEAIAKFNEVLKEAPQCAECYTNIGAVYVMKQDFEKAEANYKKAIEINPGTIEAYNGLASLYNSQKRYKEAQVMGAEAAKRGAAAGGGGNVGALYNQAAIMWNSPDADPAEIQAVLAKALQADPNHAEAHFLMGNVLVKLGAGTGDMERFGEAATSFETYLKLSPNGPNAAKAKESFEQLKTFRK
ncbi:MAG: tetratricopeptide repeat protein [Acidobacteria bacterium]|nr:tetratricopeptide repeat protein [Acidobacteriota bacterium]